MPNPSHDDPFDDLDDAPSQGVPKSTVIALAAVLVLGGGFIGLLLAFGGKEAPEPVVEEEEDPADMEGSLLSSSGSIVGDLLRRGERALNQGRYTDPPGANVRAFLKEIRRLNPSNPLATDLEKRAHDRLAKAGERAIAAQQWDRAVTLYRELVKFTPADHNAVKRLGEVRIAQKGGPPPVVVAADAPAPAAGTPAAPPAPASPKPPTAIQ